MIKITCKFDDGRKIEVERTDYDHIRWTVWGTLSKEEEKDMVKKVENTFYSMYKKLEDEDEKA